MFVSKEGPPTDPQLKGGLVTGDLTTVTATIHGTLLSGKQSPAFSTLKTRNNMPRNRYNC